MVVVVVVVVVLVTNCSGQAAALGCACAAILVAAVAAAEPWVYSSEQSSPNTRVSPRSLIAVIGGQLNSGHSSSSGTFVMVVVVVPENVDSIVRVEANVVVGQSVVLGLNLLQRGWTPSTHV